MAPECLLPSMQKQPAFTPYPKSGKTKFVLKDEF
jgi:hypothetical protein